MRPRGAAPHPTLSRPVRPDPPNYGVHTKARGGARDGEEDAGVAPVCLPHQVCASLVQRSFVMWM